MRCRLSPTAGRAVANVPGSYGAKCGLCGPLRELLMLTIDFSARARPSCHNRSTEYEIPNARRPSKVTRHGVMMMTKMSEPMAAQPRLLIKLPMVHGIVHQKIRHVSDDQPACRSASNLDIPKEREKEKEGRKADYADPNWRSNVVTRTRMVHPMELPKNRHLVVDETMHQIFSERPKHCSTQSSERPT